MDETRSKQTRRKWASWFDPEFVLYALFGLLVVGVSGQALARWALASWAEGQRSLPVVAFAAIAVTMSTVLAMLRTRKRFFYLGFALALVGIVSLALGSAGYSIPRAWFE
jgi:hypothetical protein